MLKYFPGIFDEFKKVGNYEYWNQFSEIMIGLGYEMDSCNSFEKYRKNSKLQLNLAHSTREERRNILYLLEYADRQVVGNYLFSQWR